MAIVVGLTIVALALFAAWLIGEIKNIRALRLPGALALLVIAPLAFYWGLAAGHESGCFESRALTSEFMGAAADALRNGNSKEVLVEAERLRRGADEPRKRAGSFFHDYLDTATKRLVDQTVQSPRAG